MFDHSQSINKCRHTRIRMCMYVSQNERSTKLSIHKDIHNVFLGHTYLHVQVLQVVHVTKKFILKQFWMYHTFN